MANRWFTPLRLAGAAAATAALAAALLLAEKVATDRAVDGVERRARASAILLASSYRRELDKFRLVPIVLAEDREAREALVTRDPARLAALSRKLEALGRETRAANVYLMDPDGTTIAADNWQRPRSFVGDNYGYRTYFRAAWRTGGAHQFALGQRSKLPGLYISRRLTLGGRPIGVVVVKVDFASLEREWRETATAAFVTDRRGIILVTSNPLWRFQTLQPLSVADRGGMRSPADYGVATLVQNPSYADGSVTPAGDPVTRRTRFVEATEAVGKDWRIHVLAPTTVAVANAVAVARLLLLIAVLTGGASYLGWRHRRRIAAARVEAATAARLALLNDQLVQANKLATLGQITAGFGHEINQPVAAIAAYAHNARALVARDRPAEAVEALDRIAALTQRIGLITRELRGFVRRASGDIEAVPVAEAMDGVALLLRHRLVALGAELVTAGPRLAVRAERVRLEQVLVNLIQNALDAGARRIVVDASVVGDRVEIAVIDDGAGLAPEMRDQLFQPFRTSKHDGLGLGLVICRDIVAGLGGSLELRASATGAAFVITLEHAR